MKAAASAAPVFDAEAFLSASGPGTKAVTLKRSATIYAQGNPADSVLYVQKGTVRLSVLAGSGKEAVVGVIGPGDFFGEGALAGQPVRLGTATAMTASTILVVPLAQMKRLLLEHTPCPNASSRTCWPATAGSRPTWSISCSTTARSASPARCCCSRALASLTGLDTCCPNMSQEVLAEIVGTTRSRVNVFMNKFRKLGFIEYNGDIIVHHALLSVVLHDTPSS